MKKLIISSALAISFALQAQSQTVDKKYVESVVDKTTRMLNEFYVFPEVANKASLQLIAEMKKGKFDRITAFDSLAREITKELQSVTKDKHLRVVYRPAQKGRPETPGENDLIDMLISRQERSRIDNGGFAEAKILEGNIGYLDIRFFPSVKEGAAFADAYISLLANADALIIDLRKNGGGNPSMVQYLCSYFFDKPTHLNSIYYRSGNDTTEYWTLEDLNGNHKLPEIPLFILTSSYTFSGAEEFSYNMLTQKRATIVGETTGGGANPGGTMRINEQLIIFIPGGTAINPVTGINWEGTGVKPDVAVPSGEALAKAQELALKAAKEYSERRKKNSTDLLSGLFREIETGVKDQEVSAGEKKQLEKTFTRIISEGLLTEEDINRIGYWYLENKETLKALLVFEQNVTLFPDSPNVYDSYGEALAAAGRNDEALKSYEKAVDMAIKSNHPERKMFEENLERFNKKKK